MKILYYFMYINCLKAFFNTFCPSNLFSTSLTSSNSLFSLSCIVLLAVFGPMQSAI